MKKFAFIILILSGVTACDNSTRNGQDAAQLTAYTTKGDSIVKITFDTLRNALVKTMGEKGLAGALRFCNVQALPITALYASNDISISRVTNKNRNPENELSAFDKIQWEKYEALLAKKDSLKPVVVPNNNEIHYYKPIIMQGMCLSCHGTVEKEIPKELLPVIDSLYPSDKAKGYKAGDLRGMWHLEFTKRNK